MTTENAVEVQAWTTENADAVVWGTHDIEVAKKVYRDLALDTEPDWDSGILYWGAPGLDEKEVWPPEDVARQPGDGCHVPFIVFDF